jgi:hypothetical protein
MLESTQKQIYTDDMAGFRPYKPYSTDVNQYYAGFSPLQQQAQQATAGLQTPGQYQTATGLAGLSGLGALGAGQQYAQNVTSPQSMQAYMSPYQQGVTDVAKNAAIREAQIAQNTQNLAAARQGTYGGARQTLAQAERERNLLSNLSNIQAQGSQAAYDRALQSQQFGSTLGMQGYGQAGQAASTLGQLGGQQLGAQKDIIGLQSQMGKEMQAQEQNKINQAIQDYAISQQYPFMQLGMMNAMLRGLPMQTQTTQLYQAQPSMLQQGIGLAGAAGSLFGGRAAGGAIKEYRQGGIVGYAPGGVIDSTRADLEQIAEMPDGMRRLEQIRTSSNSGSVRKIATEIIAQKQIEAKAEQQSQQSRMGGIAAAGGGLFDTMGYAGGGILAFSEGGDPEEKARKQLEEDRAALLSGGKSFGSAAMDVLTLPNRAIAGVLNTGIRGARAVTGANIPYIYGDDPSMTESLTPYYDKNVRKPALQKAAAEKEQKDLDQFDEATRRFEEERAAKKTSAAQTKEGAEKRSDRSGVVTGPKTLADFFKQQKELGPKGQVGEGFEKFIDEYTGDKDRLSRKERLAMAKGFLEFGSTAGPIGVAATKGLGTYATGAEAARDAEDKIKFESAKIKGDLDKARRAEARGDVEGAQKAFDSAANRDNQIKVAQMQLARSSEFERQYEAFKNNPAQFEQFRKSLTSQDDTARLNAYVKADTFISQAYPQLMFSKKPEDIQRLEQLRNAKVAEYLGAIGMASQGAPAGSGAKGQVDTNNALLRT